MIIEFLQQKTKLAKLFREHGYAVSYNARVYTEKYPSFDLTELHKSRMIKITGQERQKKKKKGKKPYRSDYKYAGRAAELYRQLQEKRRIFAMQVAESVHNIKPLYTSCRAEIIANSTGGEQDKDYNAYSKSYGFPAVWKNAGVMYTDGKVNVYTYRGTLVFTMALPRVDEMQKFLIGNFGVDAVYGVKSRWGTYKLYNLKNKYFTLAKQMPRPDGTGTYWEHGGTLEEITAEHAHKIEIYKIEQRKKELSAKITRAKSLARHLINNVNVTYEDARSVGYCQAGINNFIENHLDGKRIVKLSILKKFPQTSRLVDAICERCVTQRFVNI